MINEKINKKILGIWKKHFGERGDVYAPIFYDDLKTGGILFVGMNPSLNTKGARKIVRGTEFERSASPDFYRWRNIASNLEYVDMSIAIGRLIHAEYAFFKRMHEIAKEAGTHFQHADLFVYRQTKQNEFLPFVRAKDGALNEFGKDQLEVFLEVLEDINPAVIVVSNAGACAIVRDHFREKLSFDDKRGFHRLSLYGKSPPIFFSSMLSGQRALDIGSYERLKWHICEAVNGI